jgi:Aspartate-semialdehyde dehydrogenase
MKIAVVGATGLVGQVMLEVLNARGFQFDELFLVASERSVGKTISFQSKDYTVISLEEAVSRRPDIALFSAGGDTSLAWAPKLQQ